MSNVVWKFPVPMKDKFNIEMPQWANILTVQAQNGTPCIWALCDQTERKAIRTFRLVGTGHPIDGDEDSLCYIGTFQMEGGGLVFHLFEFSCKE